MRKLLIVGIGAGDPEQVTVQAIRALNSADVLFVVDKGHEKADMVRVRQEICQRYIEAGHQYRTVEIQDPKRDRTAAAYGAAVHTWRIQRADAYEAAIRAHLAEDETGAFLVWGDPALYDSTLGILEEILARGMLAFEYEVIPGISSVQALAARHRITLNRVGEAIQVTTGRRLAQGLPAEAANVVVMLDAHCAFKDVDEPGVRIFWGAYLGTPDEILLAGDLDQLKDEIQRVRTEARERKGWIMDTYLLQRAPR